MDLLKKDVKEQHVVNAKEASKRAVSVEVDVDAFVDTLSSTDLDWIDGSEDLRLSKLVASRLGRHVEQEENDEFSSSSMPASSLARIPRRAVSKSQMPGQGPLDAKKQASQEPNQTNRANSGSASIIDMPGAYALAPPENSEGPRVQAHTQRREPPSGTLSLATRTTMDSSSSNNSSTIEAGIPVANLVHDEDRRDLPEATEQDLEAQTVRTPRSEKKTREFGALFVAVSLVAFGVLLAVVLVVATNNQDVEPEPVSTPEPTAPPTMPPSHWLEGDVALHLLPDHTYDMLIDQDTPQYHAYKWLLDDIEINGHGFAAERVLQRFVLATMYMSTNGDKWHRNDNWLNHSVHECFWFSNGYFLDGHGDKFEYVKAIHPNPCEIPPSNNTDIAVAPEDASNTYVHLWLSQNQLQGTLPPELFLLTNLRSISLYTNDDLTGPIPSMIGQLTKLEAINLGDTRISGTLPTELALLSDTLFSIAIINAHLEEALPTELGLLHKLHDLLLDINHFTGTIPSELANIPDLKWLYLSENSLTGTIPEVIFNVPFEQFYLDQNQFEGTIPTEIGLLSDARKFVVYSNSFTGTIPSEVGLLTAVENLDYENNLFTGILPTELGILNNMRTFWGVGNSHTGIIPTEVIQLANISWFQVSRNFLTGTIPAELLQIPTVAVFSAEENSLSGSLPQGLSPEFEWLEVSDNALLTGSISEGLTKLTTLLVDGTQIYGSVPNEYCEIDWLDFDCSSRLCGCDCACANGTKINGTTLIIIDQDDTSSSVSSSMISTNENV